MTTASNEDAPLVWGRLDTTWTLGLFGTAVGAGILFLPINAGIGGFWPLVIITALIGPMTYLSHLGLARFVCSGSRPDADITEVVIEHFGERAGKLITVLYFLSIYPIVLIYGVGITNTVDSFLVNQLGMASPPRWLLSGALVAALMGVMMAGEHFMLMVTQWLVYPLVAILIFVSIYLIPGWNLSSVREVTPVGTAVGTIWLTLPVLVFSFSHAAAISQFAVSMRRHYGANGQAKAEMILYRTALLLVGFVMFFVFSCVLALSPAQLAEAKSQNLPVLSYLANTYGSNFISLFGPIVAFVAIASSFFGHYLGAAEGMKGLLRGVGVGHGTRGEANLNRGVALFIFLTTWGAAVLNPSILGLIEMLAGPVIAAILYLMPMYAVSKVPALARYRGRLSNIFVTIAGLASMSALVYGFI
ncbi:aromatic amino acid transport family protein [Paracoccus sp. (in: a-proteobacteria)]|uniref:aromatic amino acid transport family protein n=1 Tax=Paracoccus sp. TaxID=267 RepID=UPI00321F72B2